MKANNKKVLIIKILKFLELYDVINTLHFIAALFIDETDTVVSLSVFLQKSNQGH